MKPFGVLLAEAAACTLGPSGACASSCLRAGWPRAMRPAQVRWRWPYPANARGVRPKLEWQQDGVEGIDRQAAATGEGVDVHRVAADDLQHARGLVVEPGHGLLQGLRGGRRHGWQRPCRPGARLPFGAGAGAAQPSRPRSSSITSSAVSTSLAPSRIRRWQPRASGEWMEPGMANTSRPLSVARRAVISEPLLSAASTTSTPWDRPAMMPVATREVVLQRRRAERKFADDGARCRRSRAASAALRAG